MDSIENVGMFSLALVQFTQHLDSLALPLILYIGPDVFLPLTSALAAIAGVLLMTLIIAVTLAWTSRR